MTENYQVSVVLFSFSTSSHICGNTVIGKHRLTPCLDAFFKYFAAISRSLRYIQPSHYLFRVECVSALMNTNIEKYESGRFEAGGYKWWVYFQSPFLYLFFFFLSFSHEFFFPFFFFHICRRLCIYPNGNTKSNGKGYISLYLAIAETKKLPLGWEVNVNFKLFVFNHKHDQYLTVQGRILTNLFAIFFYNRGCPNSGQLACTFTNLMEPEVNYFNGFRTRTGDH